MKSIAGCINVSGKRVGRPFGSVADQARRRTTTLAVACIGVAFASFGALHAPVLIWNATASAPLGLYRISAGPVDRGDLVALQPKGALAATLADNNILKEGRLLLKPLAATTGDTVCRSGLVISINGMPRAKARSHRLDGRRLPTWTECRRLMADEIFILSDHALSFDSRYFGPVDATQIVGTALPVATYLPAVRESR